MPAIRLFRNADAAELVALFRASVQTLAAPDYSPSQIRAWASAITNVGEFAARCAGRRTWVAVRESQIAGFSDLEPDGHIDMLYVHPLFARQGVALTLLAHVEHVAAAAGIDGLHAEASITARPVFERRGFELIRGQTVAVRGEAMTNYAMQKRFRPGQ